MSPQSSEQTPLLPNGSHESTHEETIEFDKDGDDGNPREWPLSRKYFQTFQIFIIALICPMASSMFAPAISEIAENFQAPQKLVLAGQTAFVVMLGIGPLFFAPMSETFGRRNLFVINLAAFTLVQIPTALSPNVASFIVFRAFSGLFGSVGVANGGGSIFDMFDVHERAPVLGFYLTAPLVAPSIGPLIGALVITTLSWRWIFWIMLMLSAAVTTFCYFFLYETNAVAILQSRRKELQDKHPDVKYKVSGASEQAIPQKILKNCSKAVRILTTQPIVLIMSSYQALIFSSMYTLFAQYSQIWSSPPYNFNKVQLGLTYLGPVAGFVVASVFVVLYIDPIYNYLARRNDNDGEPEYRLAFANIGAVLLPISLFMFGWTVDIGSAWPIPLIATVLFGASQVSIFNPIQTYYIDAYAENAASALAAGAFLRSMAGGIIPLFVNQMFDAIGYGWGMSVFGLISILLMPAPLLFQRYGQRLREKYPFKG